jgi:quercetin dioxygenase-like cupin family protein
MRQEKSKDGAEELKGRVLKAAGLVDYQAGAVVSRTLVKRETGTLTLFAFDKGQGLSEHTAPFDALVFIIEGECEIRIAGNPQRVKAGEMIIMPANKPHALQAVARFKMALVMIRS